jgi:hypothetical protein
MRTNSLTIDYLPLGDVRPYAGAVRNHNRAQLRKLAKLIERFGQLPIIVDDNYTIIDGHAVYAVLRDSGRSRSQSSLRPAAQRRRSRPSAWRSTGPPRTAHGTTSGFAPSSLSWSP